MSHGPESLPVELREKLASLIASDAVVLFMKGNRQQPRCGFSAAVVEILDELVPTYTTVDVLADQNIREGIKVYSDWPTIPQLYVKGELVGGADITREMAESGELHKMLGVEKAAGGPTSVAVTVTPTAAKFLLQAQKGEPPENKYLRLAVSPRFQHQLGFSPEKPGDVKVSCDGIDVVIDAGSAKRAHGVRIDAVEQPGGVAFRIENPNEPPSVKQMSVGELAQRLADAKKSGTPVHLFDVRTPGERATAAIEGSMLLDDEGRAKVEALPKDAVLVFHCHHGGRSQAAAEHFLKQGYKTVYNVAGGIDAWSMQVDPNVPRY